MAYHKMRHRQKGNRNRNEPNPRLRPRIEKILFLVIEYDHLGHHTKSTPTLVLLLRISSGQALTKYL